MNRRLEGVQVASLRVALMASAVLAVVYTIIAAIVVIVVTNSLTSQVDTRLTSYLAGQPSSPPSGGFPGVGDTGPRFAPILYAWVVEPDGTIVPLNNRWGALPQSVSGVATPTTVNIQGSDLRIDGMNLPSGAVVGIGAAQFPVSRVIVGQTLDTVSQTRATIFSTELIVGIVLLVVAFVGALIGGRRVGAPIELARQRQMEFTADASHELRTPLSVIEAQTSLALVQERDAAWYRTAFQRISNESQRIRRLVDDLLWLARADSTESHEQAEPVEIGILATRAVERFAAVAEARKLTITAGITAEPHVISGSPEWLDRLLGVLVDNACKYAPENGRVHVRVENDGGRVRLQVEDSGPGIPAEARPRIFDRFHRASRVPGGAGLGLAIADAVVRRSHGRWEIGTSELLGGASVAVSWPRAIAGSREPAAVGAQASPAHAPSGAAPQPE